jgi:hypothetical protein
MKSSITFPIFTCYTIVLESLKQQQQTISYSCVSAAIQKQTSTIFGNSHIVGGGDSARPCHEILDPISNCPISLNFWKHVTCHQTIQHSHNPLLLLVGFPLTLELGFQALPTQPTDLCFSQQQHNRAPFVHDQFPYFHFFFFRAVNPYPANDLPEARYCSSTYCRNSRDQNSALPLETDPPTPSPAWSPNFPWP